MRDVSADHAGDSCGVRPGHCAVTIERRRRFIATTIEVEGREEAKVVEIPDRTLSPWTADQQLNVVGKPVRRVDAPEKVTGSAVYTSDRTARGLLHAVLVRSTIPHGRAVRIDLEPARAVRGFVDAIVFDDLPKDGKPIRAGGVRFLDPGISYAGHPLACVCADSMRAARAAAHAVRIEYEPAPFAATAARATEPGAPPVRPKGGNISRSSPMVCARGDADQGLAEADVVIRGQYRTPSALHSAMEPHGAVCEWHGDQLTVYEGTQGIFAVRDEVATALASPGHGSGSSWTTWGEVSAPRTTRPRTRMPRRSWRAGPAARCGACWNEPPSNRTPGT